MDDKPNLVVISGAGISVAAGLLLYRGDNGLYRDPDIEMLAKIETWRTDPGAVLEYYNRRRTQLAEVKPTSAHYLLKKMEEAFNVTIITQNVDDLHERAGSSNVLHLHGELTCVHPEGTYTKEDNYNEDEVIRIGYEEVHLGDTGGKEHTQLRPHVILFGEYSPMANKAKPFVRDANILLIVGTSLSVPTARNLLNYINPVDCSVYLIDPHPEFIPVPPTTVVIDTTAEAGMPIFANYIDFPLCV